MKKRKKQLKIINIKTNKMREEKQLAFIQKHHRDIIGEALRNEDKTGFVVVYANEDFNLVGSIRFIDEEFNRDAFSDEHSMCAPINPDQVKAAVNIYYSVLWFDNNTKWNVRETVILQNRL